MNKSPVNNQTYFHFSAGSSKKPESSRKTSISDLLTMPKPFCGSQQTVDIPLTYPNLCRGHVELSYVKQSNLTRAYQYFHFPGLPTTLSVHVSHAHYFFQQIWVVIWCHFPSASTTSFRISSSTILLTVSYLSFIHLAMP